MSALCLAAGKALVMLPVATFTLAWTHSIEKTRWEEDWLIRDDQLIISEARIRGSGAGMEPPSGAVLENGVWRYQPAANQGRPSILLTHSPYAAGYELCLAGRCVPLASLIDGIGDTGVIEMSACHDGGK